MPDPVFQGLSSVLTVGGTSASSGQVTFSTVTAGELVLVLVQRDYYANITGVTLGSQNMVELKVNDSFVHQDSTDFRLSIWGCLASAGGTNVVATASFSDSRPWLSMSGARWSNVNSATPTQSACNISACQGLAASSTTRTAQQITTTARRMVLGIGTDWNNYNTHTAANGYTKRLDNAIAGGGSSTVQFIHEIIGDAGNYGGATNFATAASDQYLSIILAFELVTDTRQILRPDGTSASGSWTASSGTLHSATSDQSDATYITSATAPSNDEATLTLSDPSGTPGSGTVTLIYNAQKVTGTKQIDLTLGVYESGSLVEAFTETDLGTTLTTYSHDLSNAISNYSALTVKPKANQSGTSPPTNPSVRAIGTHASGTTSVAFTTAAGSVPTNSEGDIVLIVLESCDSTTAAGTPADITDWTKVLADTTSGAGATGVTTLTVYGRFAPAGGVGNTTVTSIGNHGSGRMLAIQDHGCSALGDLVIGSVTDHGTGTTGLSTSGITVTANSLILWIAGLSDDAADTTNASNYANSNLASITEQADQTVATSAGGGVAIMSATCAGTTTGATTWDHDTAERSQSLHIGIKPIPALSNAAARVTEIELRVPEASTVDSLLAEDIAAGSSTLTAATLGQVHVLNANDISSGSPTLTAATLGQVHALLADDISAGSPTLTSPALGQIVALTADDIATDQPTLTSPALGQIHALLADDVAADQPTLTQPAIGQVHALTADDIATGQPTLSTPTLAESSGTDELLAEDIATGSPTITSATLGQVHALTADDVATGTPSLTSPAIGQVHALLADDVASDQPTLTQAVIGQTHVLTADDVQSGAPTLSQPNLTSAAGVDNLVPLDITAGPPTLTQPTLVVVSVGVQTQIVRPAGGKRVRKRTAGHFGPATPQYATGDAEYPEILEEIPDLRRERDLVESKLLAAIEESDRLQEQQREAEFNDLEMALRNSEANAQALNRIAELRVYQRLIEERLAAALEEEEIAMATMITLALAA